MGNLVIRTCQFVVDDGGYRCEECGRFVRCARKPTAVCGAAAKAEAARLCAALSVSSGVEANRSSSVAGPPQPPSGAAQTKAPTSGPGTELKKLLSKIGITATPNCSCNARARRMDEEEARHPGWCEEHLEEIVGWLREEATKRGLPFVDMAGRMLVRRAIKNAKRAEAET